MAAINLTEQGMRILWPPSLGRSGRTRAGHRGRGRRISAAREFAITLPTRRSRTYQSGDFCWRLEIGGAGKLKFPLINGQVPTRDQLGLDVERTADGHTGIAVKYERQLTEAISAEMGLGIGDENFNQIARHISEGDWQAAISEMFSMKIKGAFPLDENVGLGVEFSIAADANLCFFGLTDKLTVQIPLEDISDLARGYVVEVEATATIRFGLSQRGWARLSRTIGGSSLNNALQYISTRAARAGITRALLAYLGFAAVGTLAITVVSVEVCQAASDEGTRRGMLLPYCGGYLARLQHAHANPRQQSQILRDVQRRRRSRLGWQDATIAVGRSSRRSVERTLIRHFGSDFDIDWIDSAMALETRVSNVRSRVGRTVNTGGEVDAMALEMAVYLAREIDAVAAYLGRARAGGLIRSADARTRSS